MFPLLKTEKVIEKKGGNVYVARREKGKIVKKFDKGKICIQIYDKFPWFSDSEVSKKGKKVQKIINFNGEILKTLERINPRAKTLLFNLAFYFEKLILSGAGENEAFGKLSVFYSSLSDKEKEIVINALGNPEIDPGNSFKDFLEKYSASPDSEKKRLIALLKARTLIDIPYDRQMAYEVEKKFEGDLPSLRLQTLNAISSTYDPSVDIRNAERVFKWCLENNKRLLVCRFGRAFYTDALLIANSKGIRREEVLEEISYLEEKFRDLCSLEKAEEIGPELQRVLNLANEEWFSLAGIQGALKELKGSLRNLETGLIEKFDKSLQLEKIRKVRSQIDTFRACVYKLEKRISQTPKFDPAFVSFISRIHELDAVNIVRVNELLDPFFGENPKMEKLILDTGHNNTISPNPGAWLPYASDWVEALPAYAHYLIVPHNEGYKVIALTEREILEIIYKTCADDWAKNIKDVIARENVSIARRLIAKKYGFKKEKEEDIIEFIKNKKKGEEVGQVAFLIEEKAESEYVKIAALQEKEGLREKVLLQLFGSMKWGSKDLENNSRTQFYASIALEKKRHLPNVNVLTTLGPTETETNIANWLEEAMTLYNIECAYNLGDKVQKKINFFREKIGEIALAVIEEEQMEGELLRVMGEQGLKGEKEDKTKVALVLTTLYPEISYKTNKKIAEKFNIKGNFSHCLRDYVGALSRFTARREVIKEGGLSKLLDDGRYRYASSGAYKRYNLIYTPSRVDLGPEIIESVQNVPKWVGGDGHIAAKSGKALYSLFNLAGVTAVNRPQIAEFLKVGENFFTRGGVYYLSLTAGANLNTLGVGDFEFFRQEWNKRGDRTVLPTGETYGGFCVPKEFSLLFAIVTRALSPETTKEIFDNFGIPEDEGLRKQLVRDLLSVLKMRRQIPEQLRWEEQAIKFLESRYSQYIPRLPQLALTLNKAGTLYEDKEVHNSYLIANWKNKKALGNEEINRSGVFDKVRLINLLINEAKKKDPEISMENLAGVMPAGYKEDVTDVRFSAGARKLEIYAGLFMHLLEDIDPEGREIYKNVMLKYPSPLDIRLVGVCTAKDMFGHVPMNFSSYAREVKEILLKEGYNEKWIAENVENFGIDLDRWEWGNKNKKEKIKPQIEDKILFLVYGDNLAQISDGIKKRILKYGLTEETVNANAYSFGGDIRSWKGLKEKDKERLIREIGSAKHVFITEARGIYSKERYEAAIGGSDFIDLGIPDKELLDLIDNLPKLIYLMEKGDKKSLIFADGTSGARRPSFSFRYPGATEKVKELFALSENALYGCLGIGRETIHEWKKEMLEEKEDARLLLSAVSEKRLKEAELIYEKIVQKLKDRDKDEEFIRQEINAREFGVWRKYYRYASSKISAIIKGIPLKKLDFGSFLIIGGRWLLNGKVSIEELEEIRENYEFSLVQEGKKEEIGEIIAHCFKEKHIPEEEEFKEVSTGVSGSLKAVEELVLKLETKEIRRQQLELALRLNERRNAFHEEIKKPAENFDVNYRKALEQIGFGRFSEEKFGRFLALGKKIWMKIVDDFLKEDSFKNEFVQELNSTFRGGNILDTEYDSLERKGTKIFENIKNSKQNITRIAEALELLDISLLIEKTMYVNDSLEMWKAIARFFDATINNHIFDYVPYHYSAERTSAFKNWSREEIFSFAIGRHKFLHQLVLYLLRERTSLKDKSEAYKNSLLGKFDKNGNLIDSPIGVNLKNGLEKKWFSYARLRDLTTLVFDGYPLPEIEENLKLKDGVNVGIVYPLGNTTVSVALEQAPRLSSKNINLFLVPFPEIVEKKGTKFLVAKEIFFRDEKGTWILGRLNKELIIHAVWFHFTHFLRPEIEKIGMPLIQPLLWEAATYLKCDLPGMVKGSGISCPDQYNWYSSQTEKFSMKQVQEKIEKAIKNMAKKHKVLIVKAEKESGGRGSKILPVRNKEGGLNLENIKKLADLTYDLSKTDNVVIQEVIPSKVRKIYSQDSLEKIKERFITELGIGIQDDTPLFSYFRLIVMKKPSGEYAITHRITVVSTAGIANVGQGGRLFEYRNEKINEKYSKDLEEELEFAALSSLKSQEGFIKKNRRRILGSYLKAHREFSFEKEALGPHSNALGVPDWEILYEMGDYLPVFLVDDHDNLQRIYHPEKEEFISLYENGKLNSKIKVYNEKGIKIQQFPIKLFEGGIKRKLFWQLEKGKKYSVKSLTIVKIEPNPGAGLWRPHNDRLKLVGRDGEGVCQVFEILGEWGKKYKKKIM
ncbi:MAG: hypothetical protein ABIK53_04430 [bacterium]